MRLKLNTSKSTRIGFTLVELLVVISIIALLLAMLMPALQKARKQAQGIVCMSDVKQIGLGIMLYKTENKGSYCYSTGAAAQTGGFSGYDEYYNKVTFWKFVGPYIKNQKANKCPSNPANALASQLTSSTGQAIDMVFGYSYNTEFGYVEPDPNHMPGSLTTPWYKPVMDTAVRSPSTKIVVVDSALAYYETLYMYNGQYPPFSSMEYSYRIFPGGMTAKGNLMQINYQFKIAGIHNGGVNNTYADGSAGRQSIINEVPYQQWFPTPDRGGLSNGNPWGIPTRRPNSAPKQ